MQLVLKLNSAHLKFDFELGLRNPKLIIYKIKGGQFLYRQKKKIARVFKDHKVHWLKHSPGELTSKLEELNQFFKSFMLFPA